MLWWRRQLSGVPYIFRAWHMYLNKNMAHISCWAVRAAVIKSLVFCSLSFMVRMNDSEEEWFTDALCLTDHAVSTLSVGSHWTLNWQEVVMSINELLEVRPEFCMCMRSTDSNWMQRWLRGALCTMELPLWASHVPCHVVYRSIRSGEEIHELYIWHTSTAPQHLKANGADIMRVGDWPFESCGLYVTADLQSCSSDGLDSSQDSPQKQQTILLLLAQVYEGLHLYKNNTIPYFSCIHWFVFWA